MEELKRGQIAVSKTELVGLLDAIYSVEQNIDKIMKEPESTIRGQKIAKELNRLTYLRHSFQHFQLQIPLKKLK